MEFQNCTLKIDKNLFYDLALRSNTSPQSHTYKPSFIEELVFDQPGMIKLLTGSLNMFGNATVIFRNDNQFRPSYEEGNIFNANVSTVIIEHLHFFSFSSDFFIGIQKTGHLEIRHCVISRQMEKNASSDLQIQSFRLANVTLHPSSNGGNFLRLSEVNQAIFSDLQWKFDHMFISGGIILKATSELIFERCGLFQFRPGSFAGEVTQVSFIG